MDFLCVQFQFTTKQSYSLITRFSRLLPQRLLGTTNIEGKVAPQDLGLPGGQIQNILMT